MVAPAGFSFAVTARDPASRARVGWLETPHGGFATPAFIPCATAGVIKGLPTHALAGSGVSIILGNTYHLMVRPGVEVIAAAGGLHRFMGWRGPLLTDSGGFQVFSLAWGGVSDEIKGRRRHGRPPQRLAISPEGVVFRSPVDGSRLLLSPERAMTAQAAIGADLILVLDECTPYHHDKSETARSLELTHEWTRRSIASWEASGRRGSAGAQALYAIVQGGVWPDLRARAVAFVNDCPVFGQAIGGCLGGGAEEMRAVVTRATCGLNPDRPTHLLGIGSPADILHAVRLGVDTFDCVHPTRVARHGVALMYGGRQLNLSNSRFRDDHSPLDDSCDCPCCRQGYSRAYLRHLFKAREAAVLPLLVWHNLRVMTRLFAAIRREISRGGLEDSLRQRERSEHWPAE